MTEPEPRIPLREAADTLGIHYMTAYRQVRLGQLHATQRGGRWFVSASGLAAYAQRPTDAGPAAGRGPVDWSRRQHRLFTALIGGDEPAAWRQMESAFAVTHPTGVYADLLVPTLRAVGDAWAAGDASVADEHRASAVAMRLVGRCGPRFRRRGRTQGCVVLACLPGERHALPAAILADVLRANRWTVVDLGADVPAVEISRAAVGADRVRAVGISCTMSGNDEASAEVIAELRHALPHLPILLGGAGVGIAGGDIAGGDTAGGDTAGAGTPVSARALGADACAREAWDVPALLEGLIRGRRTMPSPAR